MASYVDLDSIWRERESYPNENDYQLLPAQVKTWVKQNRTVTSTSRNPGMRPLEFAVTIEIKYLALPYTADLMAYPRVYVNFRSRNYDDIRLIDCIDGKHPDAKFVCSFDKIQYDSLNNPVWIHYKSGMKQTMRFERGQPVVFQVCGRNDIPLPQQDTPPSQDPDPLKQTLCTFEIKPYEIDGEFSETRNSQPLPL